MVGLLAFAQPASAREGWRGWCEQGNNSVVTSGISSTNKVQLSYPRCQVLVLVHGAAPATIFADNNGTPLANPFQSNLDGSWLFYANDGRYDISTTRPDGLSFTYLDVLLCDPFVPGAVCSGAASGAHNLLSTTHLDTIPASPPARGDLITAQNLTSPSSVNPAWARLALGTSGQLLVSNGLDAVWGNLIAGTNITLSSSSGNTTINATGTGCSPPGTNTGVITEHPVGVCYDSAHYTWDDTNFNLQVSNASANTVGTNNTFIIGPNNNLSSNTFGFVVGDANDLSISQSHAYVVGSQNIVKNLEVANFVTISLGSNTIGDATHANSGGKQDTALGPNNTMFNAETVDAIGSNCIGKGGGSGKEVLGDVIGGNSVNGCGSSTGNGTVGSISGGFGVFGQSNSINASVGDTGTADPVFIGGFTNAVHTSNANVGGAYIWGLDNSINGALSNDVVIVGSSNTSNSSASASCLGASDNFIGGMLNTVTSGSNFGVFGAANTISSKNCAMIFGMNITASDGNTAFYGVSATAEIQVATTSGTNGSLTQLAYAVANASPTGTTVNHLAKLTTAAPSTVIISTAGDTSGVVGVVVGGAGTTGSAMIAFGGETMCAFDGGTTAGHYAAISASVNGDCTDAGASLPGSGQVIGRVLSTNGGAGTYKIILNDLNMLTAGGGGGDTTAQYLLNAADGTLTNSRVLLLPDTPPASANALDDEMNGASLSGSWTFANQGSCTTAEGSGWLGITCPSNGGGNNLRYIYKAAPATPWEFEIKTTWNGSSSSTASYVGLIAIESSSNKSVTAFVGGNATPSAVAWTNLTTINGSSTVGFPYFPQFSYLKIKSDGTTITTSFSEDGVNFVTIQTYTIATFYTTAPDRIGIFVDPAAQATVQGVDFFRRTL